MSFGFGGGFGAASSSPFGQSTAASPFGQTTQQQQQQQPAFGSQAPNPFGASTSTGVFGQQQPATPAFGSTSFGAKPPTSFGTTATASAPAFGAAATPAFGSTPFGQTAAPATGGGGVFGQAAPSAFGQGAAAAGGGGGGFGSTTFGAAPTTTTATGTLGGIPGGRGSRVAQWRKHQETDQSSTGAKSTVFFNSISCMPEYANKSVEEIRWEDYQDNVKGSTSGAVGGGGGGMFGAQQQQQQQPGAAASQFGAPTQTTGFGGGGGTTAFGATSSFGAAGTSTPAFGGFGAASTPAFGAAGSAASAPAFGGFGAASTPAFGAAGTAASAPAFGGFGGAPTSTPFGTTTTTAFGQQQQQPQQQQQSAFGGFGATTSTPAFGAAASTPAFGGFGTASSAPAFGAPSTTPAFGGFGATTSAPAFGAAAASTPAFGAQTTTAPAFGGFGTGTATATSAPAFGAPSTTPAFGTASGGGLFGAAKPATTSTGFGFSGNTGGSLFGAATTPAFGATGTTAAAPAGGGGLFGAAAASTPAFGAAGTTGGGGLFGVGGATGGGLTNTTTSALGGFSFATPGGTTTSTPSFALQPFGATTQQQQQQQPGLGGGLSFGGAGTTGFGQQTTAAQQQQQQGGAPPTAGGRPYGTLPEPPRISAGGGTTTGGGYGQHPPPPPENRVGLTQRNALSAPHAANAAAMMMMGPPRPVALVTPRSITPKAGVRMRPRLSMSAASSSRMSISSRSPTPSPHGGGTMGVGPMSMTPPGGTANGGTALNIFIPREDPRRLFVRDPLPSTQGSYGPGSVSPAMMMMGGSGGGRRTGGGGGGGGGGGAMTPAPVKITGGGGDGIISPKNIGTAGGGGGGIGTNGRRTAAGGTTMISPSSQQQQLQQQGGRYIDERTVASHLPHLTRPDYYCEPSLPQLAAMAREDLSSLTSVSNFTVGRKGVGSVRWLDGTDVTGLDIDSIISLEDGSVEVYLDVEEGEEEGGGNGGAGPSTAHGNGSGNGTRKGGGQIQKPEVGTGLNKPAEITMLNVFKIDKATGKPTTDAEALERFTRKLRRLTSDQGAKFISYDAATGTWRFEVEHFSKYGLIDGSDDDEDDNENGGGGGKQQGRNIGTVGMTPAAGVFKGSSSQLIEHQQQQQQQQEEEGEGEEDSDDADVAMLGLKSAVRRRHEEGDTMTGAAAAGRKKRQAGFATSPPQSRPVQTSGMTAALMMDDVDYDASRAPLQVTLAAQLGLEPEEMMRVKEGLFPAGTGTTTARQRSHYQHPRVSAAPASIPQQQQQQQQQSLPSGLLLSKKRQEEQRQGREDVTMADQQQQEEGGVSNIWQKQRPALLPPSPSSSSQRPQPSSTSTQTLMPQLPASPTPVSALKLLPPSMLCPIPFPYNNNSPSLNNININNERCLPDAGLLLGSSFRSGWSLDGRFAAPGRGGGGGGNNNNNNNNNNSRNNNSTTTTAAQVGLVKVKVGGGVKNGGNNTTTNNNNDKMKRVLGQLLTVHLSWSTGVVVDDYDNDDGVVSAPRWSVKCSRREELAQLTSQLAQLCNDNNDEISGHQAETWHLVDILFSELPAEAQQQQHINMRLSSPMSTFTSPEEEQEEEELVSLDLGRLITFQRRAMLSHWLKSVVSSRVANDVAALSTSNSNNNSGDGGGDGRGEEEEEEVKIGAKILAQLSGHQLVAACSTAIAAGDVRLATLLAKAGCSSNHYNNSRNNSNQQQTSSNAAAAAPLAPRTQLNLQLSVWQDAGFLDHISPTLIKVYELLAGRVDDVIPHMFDIITMYGDSITTTDDDDDDDDDDGYKSREDWRRCLGMHLWYGCPPTATIGDVLSSYTYAAEAGVAPPPLPKYCERPDNKNSSGGAMNDDSDSDDGDEIVPFGGARDVAFELLRLHAVAADMGQPPAPIDNAMMEMNDSNVEDYFLAIAPLIPRLLRPAGVTPDPLDHSFTWFLSTVLQSIGAIPSGYKGEELFATCMGFVSQLILLLLDGQGSGDMCHWAVYVALHLPDDNLRTSVVQHLLCGFCEYWEGDEEKVAFFKETLGIPATWLATARALRAHSFSSSSSSSGSVDVELECLLEAEAWEEAHSLLISHAAPAWVIAGTPLALNRLREVTSRLEQQYYAISQQKDHQTGSSSSSSVWRTGGGLYAAYLLLKDDYEGEMDGDGDDGAVFTSEEERKGACLKLSAALDAALERRGGGKSNNSGSISSHGVKKQAALRYAALTRMKVEVKKWLSTMRQQGGDLPNVEE